MALVGRTDSRRTETLIGMVAPSTAVRKDDVGVWRILRGVRKNDAGV